MLPGTGSCAAARNDTTAIGLVYAVGCEKPDAAFAAVITLAGGTYSSCEPLSGAKAAVAAPPAADGKCCNLWGGVADDVGCCEGCGSFAMMALES